jgi:hypothetical protein
MFPSFVLSLWLVLAALPASAAETKPAADVETFLATWVKAQNQGRFEDYRVLYARKFQGIKRSGPRIRRFGLDAWLRDREKMFKKPMTVQTSDVKITVAGNTAMLRFMQAWESKSYKDRGPKQMVLTAEGGAWRIAQEAMLASSQGVAEHQAAKRWFFVVDGRPILTSEPDKAWGRGTIRVDDAFGAQQAVTEASLPEELRRYKGEKLTLVDAAAATCTATVTGFHLVAHATWHFATLETWRSTDDFTKKEIAEQIWKQAAVFLAADLAYDGAPCKAIIAKPATGGALVAIPFKHADPPTERAARDAFTALNLPSVNQDKDKLDGEDEIVAARLSPGIFRSPLFSRAGRVIFLGHVPGGDCGEPTSGTVSVAHLWTEEPTGTWKRLVTDPDRADALPLLLVDLDQDGVPEIVYSGKVTTRLGVMNIRGETFEVQGTLEIPYYDCPC